jgi:hypothetical protein
MSNIYSFLSFTINFKSNFELNMIQFEVPNIAVLFELSTGGNVALLFFIFIFCLSLSTKSRKSKQLSRNSKADNRQK